MIKIVLLTYNARFTIFACEVYNATHICLPKLTLFLLCFSFFFTEPFSLKQPFADTTTCRLTVARCATLTVADAHNTLLYTEKQKEINQNNLNPAVSCLCVCARSCDSDCECDAGSNTSALFGLFFCCYVLLLGLVFPPLIFTTAYHS